MSSTALNLVMTVNLNLIMTTDLSLIIITDLKLVMTINLNLIMTSVLKSSPVQSFTQFWGNWTEIAQDWSKPSSKLI